MSKNDLLIADCIHSALVQATNGPNQAPDADKTIEAICARLRDWEKKYRAAKAPATLQAVRADWQVLLHWCERNQISGLPMSSEDLLAFMIDMVALGKKRSTVNRYVNSIRLIHRAARLPDPTHYPDWNLDRRAVELHSARHQTSGTKQAEPLRIAGIEKILASLHDIPLDLRDGALVALASDTLCRGSELAALRLEDIRQAGNAWSVDVRRSKAKPGSLGSCRYCSTKTKGLIDAWCARAGITKGYLFIPVGLRSSFRAPAPSERKPLGSVQVARILRRRGIRAGIEGASALTGHSARVGSAVDLLEAGHSVEGVKYAGGWRDHRQVLRYGKRGLTVKNPMAKLRERQTRTAPAADANAPTIDPSTNNSVSAILVRPTTTFEMPRYRSLEAVQARLAEWEAEYSAARSAATIRAMRADWKLFQNWCERNDAWAIPVAKSDLLQFLSDMVVLGKKRSTIDRYINTIRLIHHATRSPDPTKYPDWKIDRRAMIAELAEHNGDQPKRAEPLRTNGVERIRGSLKDAPLDLRDGALICLASDTLCREAELAVLRLEDIRRAGNVWEVDVRRSMTGEEGLGCHRYCSPETKVLVDAWCARAGIDSGYLFFAVGPKRNLSASAPINRKPLGAAQVGRILRRRGIRAGIEGAVALTGHSARVGSAVELLEAGHSIEEIQLAGGWSSYCYLQNYLGRARFGKNSMTEPLDHRSRRASATHPDDAEQ